MKELSPYALALALGFSAAAHATPVVSNSSNATAMAAALQGNGITISNAVFGTSSDLNASVNLRTPDSTPSAVAAGTFTGGASSVGFDGGVVLSTGADTCTVDSAGVKSCVDSGGTSGSSLKFDFESTSGRIFFNYVFASNEYPEFVNSNFNDLFELRLNGVNLAVLPNGLHEEVSINNVNCTKNASFFRNNTDHDVIAPNGESLNGCAYQNLDIPFGGLTTVLNFSADLVAGINQFEFVVYDLVDANFDSAVFLQAGSFSSDPTGAVPEPGTLVLAGLALLCLVAMRRDRHGMTPPAR